MSDAIEFGGTQVRDMVDGLRAVGADMDALLRTTGLDPAALGDGSRIPGRTVLDLLDEAARRTSDPSIGLRAGMRAPVRGPLLYLVLSSATLETGLRHSARFAALMISTLRIALERQSDRQSIVYDFGERALALHRQLVGYLLMANLCSMQRTAMGELTPREVHLQFPDPGGGAEARAFGCPVRFRRRETRLVFAASDLRRESRTANPLVAAQIEKFAASLLVRPEAPSLRARVVDTTRTLLARGEMPASQIAFEAGFSHQSHMARCMRRVLGVTPAQVARTRS